MVIGMIYYSPFLFGNRWVELLKIDSPKFPIGLLSAVTIATSVALAVLLHVTGAETIGDGALIGALIGVMVSLAYAKDFVFGIGTNSKNALHVYFITIGYHFIALTIIGSVMMIF